MSEKQNPETESTSDGVLGDTAEAAVPCFRGFSIRPDRIGGLTAELRHGHRHGLAYAYIVFLDDCGLIKWRIEPIEYKHRPFDPEHGGLTLRHRNSFGTRNRYHAQQQHSEGSARGVRVLLDYIAGHEAYERGEENPKPRDRCPCGSGRIFKNCHGKRRGDGSLPEQDFLETEPQVEGDVCEKI